ncbi:MAG: T9SS type A sorting domain-containing protein [Candidatus Eisenbacteria bacterium]|uniref:T9SS type A sorting domain-containing protein n=1 Tax=Eiseniibacteriota bacterium TaxID=2212470 RepID=A0A7Y2E8P9_UNCEI|nr:T9SS type A sorting domain-containing protein [Candidatus Eisenbacteria bacterium]
MKHLMSRTCLLTLALVVAVSAPALAGTGNLFTNPGFEDPVPYNGWTTFGSGPNISTPSTDNIARTDTAAAKIFGEGSLGFDVGGFFQSFTPTVGDVYTISGYSFVSSADSIPGTDVCNFNRCIAKIVFKNSGGAEIQVNEIVIGAFNTPQDAWIPFEVSAPAPAGATTIEALFLFLQPIDDPGAVFIDDVCLNSDTPVAETNALTNPSFTSGLTGWSSFCNVVIQPESGQLWRYRTLTGALKLFGTFVPDSDSGISQTVAATPGSFWKLSAYGMHNCQDSPLTGTNFMRARLVFRDAGANEIWADEVTLVDANTPVDTWTQSEVIAWAPPTTVAVEAFVLFTQPTNPGEGGAAYLDDVLLTELSPTSAPAPNPVAFKLHQNMPNPVSLNAANTRIDFDLLDGGFAEVSIFDVTGRMVNTLHRGQLEAGSHSVTWDGTTANGTRAAAGVYRYVLKTSEGQVARTLVLIK